MPAAPKTLSALILGSALLFTLSSNAQELSFSANQAEQGKVFYQENCQLCHGNKLSNGQFGTPLKGSYFRRKWAGKTLGELLQFTNDSMPPEKPGSLPQAGYAQAVAYILSQNKLVAGDTDIAADPTASSAINLPW